MQEYLEKTRQELRLRNYSFKTIKVYLGCLKEYFDFKKFDLEKIDEEKIKKLGYWVEDTKRGSKVRKI